MRAILLMTTLAFGLAGCGSEVDGDGTPTRDEEAPAVASKAGTGSAGLDTIKLSNEKFDANFYSVEQAMDKSVFGTKFNMTPAQVRAALTEAGFSLPPEMIARHPNHYKRKAADIGFARGFSVGPGDTQKFAYSWIRLPSGVSLGLDTTETTPGAELLTPFFYIDEDGAQRFYGFRYTMNFEEPRDVDTYAATLQKSLGEPTKSSPGWGVYLIQLPIPKGYVPSERDGRGIGQTQLLYPVKAERRSCFTQMEFGRSTFDPALCQAIFDGDAKMQRRFDAMTTESNQFIEYRVNPQNVRIQTQARWLPGAVKMLVNERRVLDKVSEAEARKARTDSAPEGL